MNITFAAPNRKKSSNASPTILFWIIIMGLFMAELLFGTWCRVQCTEAGYAIDKENRNYRGLLSLKKNLEIELTQLKSPARIAKIARMQLGLDIPKSEQIRSMP